MPPQTGQFRRTYAGIAVVAVALCGALLPQWLGSRLMRPVFERIFAARLGFRVAIGDADLRWSGPQTLRGVGIASADGFGNEPLFTAGSVVFHGSLRSLLLAKSPARLECDQPALVVIRAPGGTSNLDRFLETANVSAESPWTHVDLRQGSLRVEDHATGARFDADTIEATLTPTAKSLRARCANADGFGRLRIEDGPLGSDARRCVFEAHGVDLRALDPLLRPFAPKGAQIAGLVDVDLDVTRHADGSLDCAANGSIVGWAVPGAWLAAIGLVPSAGPGDVRDPHASFAGRVAFDASSGDTEFEHFAFRTTFFELSANGRLCADAARAAQAPLDLHAAVNFDFLDQRAGPLVGTALPFLGGTGYLELDAKRAAQHGYDVRVLSKRASFYLANGLRFDWPETEFAAVVDLGERLRSAKVDLHSFDMRGGELRGSFEVRDLCDVEMRAHWTGDWEPIETFIAQSKFGSFWDGAGVFDADVTLTKSGSRWTLGATLAAEDLALQLSPREGNFVQDDYIFRGKPFTARIDAAVDTASSVKTWSGHLKLDAPVAEIRDDTFTDLAIHATLGDGVVTLDRCAGQVHDGSVTAAGTITLADGADAVLDLELRGEQLALGGHSSEWSGLVCPIFSAKKGPWRVTGTPRLSGSLHVRATGYGPRSMTRTAEGGGEFHWSAGVLAGSALLDRLAPPESDGASRAIAGIDTTAVFENARVRVETLVLLPGRSPLRITGASSWASQYEQEIDSTTLLPEPAFLRHRDALAGLQLPLRGTSSAPDFRVPVVPQWLELDAEGGLEAEIAAFSRP